MALPIPLLQQKGVRFGRELTTASEAPSLTELSTALREALLIPGAVVEVAALPGKGALSLSLLCVAEALARSSVSSASSVSSSSSARSASWAVAIDPAHTLHAPAVAALGLPLERLVVVTPPSSSLLRLSVRVMRAGVFCAAVVDATGRDDLDDAVIAVRRLTLAAEKSAATVFFLTDERARRRQPLPSAVRVRVDSGGVVVERHRQGLQGTLPWEPPRSPLSRFWSG